MMMTEDEKEKSFDVKVELDRETHMIHVTVSMNSTARALWELESMARRQ